MDQQQPSESRNPEIRMQVTTSSSPIADQQHTFVVENLEGRIRDSVKQSSMQSDESRTSLQSISSSFVPDPEVLTSLERHANAISTNINVVLRDLRMSELTVQATECFADAISASCNSVDATIKNTYALLAKVEEVTEAMAGVRKLSQQVKDIKRVVDLFEIQLVTSSMA
uniref:BLOC-1-related complex subunit 6 C-terminal helix domain-containing protein n=1 Tax=Wuchereria bancrofti TaxID=6293 RepID=A0A1I8EVG3_WUCBA